MTDERVAPWLFDRMARAASSVALVWNDQRTTYAELVRRVSEWERELAKGNWLGLGYPVELGGREATLFEQVIFHQTYVEARAPGRLPNMGLTLAGHPRYRVAGGLREIAMKLDAEMQCGGTIRRRR